jgi:hypothetical protein
MLNQGDEKKDSSDEENWKLRRQVRAAISDMEEKGILRKDISEDSGADESVVQSLLGKHGDQKEAAQSKTDEWFSTRPIEIASLKRLRSYVVRTSVFDGFSKQARDAIQAKSGWYYIHKTLISTPARQGTVEKTQIWKLHQLKFKRSHSMYIADTKSRGSSLLAKPTMQEERHFRYFLSGSTGSGDVSRLFIYGRRLVAEERRAKKAQAASPTTDRATPVNLTGAQQADLEIHQSYADLPGERVFPHVQFRAKGDPQVFAGIGIWTDWQLEPKPVLSQCLLLNDVALSGHLASLSKAEDGADLADRVVDERSNLKLYEYLARVWQKEWTKSATDNLLPSH